MDSRGKKKAHRIPKTKIQMSKEYEIWSEGYLCTGMEGVPAKADFHGRFEGETFQDACDKWAETLKDEYSRSCYDRDRLVYWGCKLFDNEDDARKSFG